MDNPSLTTALGYIVVALITGLVTIFIQRRMQPSQIANTAALTLSSLQGTLASVLDREDKTLDKLDSMRTLASDLREQLSAVTSKLETAEALRLTDAGAFKTQIEDLKEQIKRLTDGDIVKEKNYAALLLRAEEAEESLKTMKEWVPDKIRDLQDEIKQLKTDAGKGADARVVEAENTKTALAAALAQVPPDLKDDAKTDSAMTLPPTESAPAGTMTVVIPADTKLKTTTDTTAKMNDEDNLNGVPK